MASKREKHWRIFNNGTHVMHTLVHDQGGEIDGQPVVL